MERERKQRYNSLHECAVRRVGSLFLGVGLELHRVIRVVSTPRAVAVCVPQLLNRH